MLTKLFIGIIILSSFAFIKTNNPADPCEQLKHGTFKYLDIEDTTAYFVSNGKDHMEYYANSKYYIKSVATWKKDCNYSLLMMECTIPDFPFKPKDVLNVHIEAIKGDTFYCHCQVKDVEWKGRFLRVK